MTRLPTESWDLKGMAGPEYPPYKVGPLCCVPGCSSIAEHGHHIVRRSAIGGPFDWVRMPNGIIVQNKCALCYKCHSLVTENRADIRWTGIAFVWHGPADSIASSAYQTNFHLDPQPKRWLGLATELDEPKSSHAHVGPASGESCPTCKRRIPMKVEGPKEKKRHREKWAITVPKDERENGADVLDALLQSCAELFGHDETKELRYFSLVQALSLVVQHGDRMVGDD